MRTEIGYTKKWAYRALGVGVALMFIMVKSYVELSAQISSLTVRYEQMSDNIKQIRDDLKAMRPDSRIKLDERRPMITE